MNSLRLTNHVIICNDFNRYAIRIVLLIVQMGLGTNRKQKMPNSIIIAGNHIVVSNNDSKFIKRYEYKKGQCSFLYGQ